MKRRNAYIIVGVIILVLAVIAAKTFTKPSVTATEAPIPKGLRASYEQVKASDKPSLVIFSYEGDC